MEYQHPRKRELFDNDFEILKFRDLPAPYQMAMAWYMAIDGEAWCDVLDGIDVVPYENSFSNPIYHETWKKHLEQKMPEFVDLYGDVEFGVGLWPTADIAKTIAADEHIIADTPEDVTIASYAKGRPLGTSMQNYHKHEYPEEGRYPVILSSFDEETLQDGWKRFSLYARSGFEMTPVIFYPREWHYDLLREREVSPPRM